MGEDENVFVTWVCEGLQCRVQTFKARTLVGLHLPHGRSLELCPGCTGPSNTRDPEEVL